MSYYNKCTECGSNLDPSEKCDCEDRERRGRKHKKECEAEKKESGKKHA